MMLPDIPLVLDRAEGVRRAGGDEKLFRELAEVFLTDLPRLTQLIRTAIAEPSAKGLRLAAHSLKGSAAQLGARVVMDRAGILEKRGKDSDLQDAARQYLLLADELRQLSLVLRAAIQGDRNHAAERPAPQGDLHD